MAAFLYPIYTLVSLVLSIWAISLFQQGHKVSTIMLIFVLAGMTYDNLIVSVGSLITEGGLLKLLNRFRFIFHNLFVPLLVVNAFKQACDAGVTWANHPIVAKGCWTLTIGIITLGLLNEIRQQELIPVNIAGTLRYRPQIYGVPILTILTAILVAVAGFCIWQEIQCPWMFVGTVVMLCCNALPKNTFGVVVSSASDFLFMLGLLATELILY
ncbi:hypothetical protein QUB80_24295 [Chlorogloeopsis sp. ULAP01]|uniref:hypothetical protein n=1 Tax=Chlorogloeopsis sp. ULAP01 TaxID=3056483 RepID=UPI0025AAA773|nr:hypothetical protein [Chlorogloeopsis sp. ULAP01]MDM9383809.1 hypothetical protein [Chlorogloeopsis sp. ULAP01]